MRGFHRVSALDQSHKPISRDPEIYDRAERGETKHIEFMVEMYMGQVGDVHYVLYAHLVYATSWQLRWRAELMGVPTVQLAQGDQCQYGAEAQSGSFKGSPILKPTGSLGGA